LNTWLTFTSALPEKLAQFPVGANSYCPGTSSSADRRPPCAHWFRHHAQGRARLRSLQLPARSTQLRQQIVQSGNL